MTTCKFGCGKPSWNGQADEFCSTGCKTLFVEMQAKLCLGGCGKPSWNMKEDEWCSSACKNQHQAVWSVHQTHDLGGEGSEGIFLGPPLLAPLENDFSSVQDAVQFLQTAPPDRCPGGLCVVFSARAARYMLIYRSDKTKDCFDKFGLLEPGQEHAGNGDDQSPAGHATASPGNGIITQNSKSSNGSGSRFGYEALPEDDAQKKDAFYNMSKRKGERFPFMAKMVTTSIFASMQKMVEQFGSHDDDEEWELKEFTLFGGFGDRNRVRGRFRTSEALLGGAECAVEIEDTENDDEVQKAVEAVESVLWSTVYAGAQVHALILGYGLWVWLDPATGVQFSMPASFVVILLHFYSVNVMSKNLSLLKFEGRPLARMMFSFSGMDDFRFQSAFSAISITGRFSRVVFVAHMVDASDDLVEAFHVHYPVVSAQFSLGNVALISMFVALLFTCWLFLKSFCEIDRCLQLSKQNRRMGISLCMDDLGALADCALLDPIAKVWGVAALPSTLEDLNDAYRVWDKMRTDTIRSFVKVMPDSIVSLYVQVIVFSLTYKGMHWVSKMSLCGSIFVSWASALNVARDMLGHGVYLSIATGIIVAYCCLDLLLRFFGVLVCESHVISLWHLSCDLTP